MVEAFIFDRQANNLRQETLEWYGKRLGAFVTWADGQYPGAVVAEVLTTGVVRRYKVHLAGRGLQAASVNGHLRALRALAKFAAEEEVLEEAPKFDLVREDRKLPRVLNDNEITTLLAATDAKTLVGARDAAMMLLLLDSGARIGELTRAKVGDLDLENHTLKVLRKCREEQRLPYGDETARSLLKYLKLRARKGSLRDDAPLLIGRNGRPLTRGQAEHRLEYYRDKKGIKESCSPHTWRRTFATRRLRAGCNIVALAGALGHADISTTQKYCRADDSDLAEMQRQYGVVDSLFAHRR
jgi:site-specific recombinase XerD